MMEIVNRLPVNSNKDFNSNDLQKIQQTILSLMETMQNVSKTEILV